MSANLQSNTRDVFFSPRNEAMLQRLLVTDFQRRVGAELNDKQTVRLMKTVQHYMTQVYDDSENTGRPVQDLNKEVLQAVVPDYMSYLKRAESQTRPTTATEMNRIQTDVTSRFDSMQTERQGERKALPAPPKFALDPDEPDPTSMNRFEELKRLREAEARRIEETQQSQQGQVAPPKFYEEQPLPTDMVNRIESEAMFRTNNQEAAQADATALAVRSAARTMATSASQGALLPVPPDRRNILFGDQIQEGGGNSTQFALGPRGRGIPNANPTLALPDTIRTRPVLPQDVLKKEDDVISYRENEYNLFIYSADRDWVNNTSENRYNFSVNFDPANNRQGFNISPSTYIRFKNITRIELVKVIMPLEACDTLTTKTSGSAYDTSKSINVFSYPYLQVRIDELNTNGYGTNDGLNNAFGVISYDAYWTSDTDLKNTGYTRMIPKFLKCQKVYHPTPLATLQRMTIQLQKPDGTQLCTSADALDVSGVVTSAQLTSGAWLGGAGTNVTGTYYTDTSGEFLWVQMDQWFSQFTFTQGDRVVFKNVTYPSAFGAAGALGTNDFLTYLNRPEGHIVVDIAQLYKSGATVFFKDGSNKQAYSNVIIIRNKFNDPTTGAVTVANFGGSSATNTAFLNAVAAAPNFDTGRVLNLNHQIQLIFRVITRDLDSSARLRPDNNF